MKIISSLPIIRRNPESLQANNASRQNKQQQDQGGHKTLSQPATFESNESIKLYRSERVDLRALHVESENLSYQRVRNAYQQVAEITEPAGLHDLARLDLFV